MQDIPIFEESGLVVRVPDWWKPSRPPRPVVNVKIDGRKGTTLDVDALLDFSVNVTLDGEPLTEAELERFLESVGGLVAIKGKWVEVDRDKLGRGTRTLEERRARNPRERPLLLRRDAAPCRSAQEARLEASSADQDRDWIGLTAGSVLEETLHKLAVARIARAPSPPGLRAELRHYQQTGVSWLPLSPDWGWGLAWPMTWAWEKPSRSSASCCIVRPAAPRMAGAGPAPSLARCAGLASGELEGGARAVRTVARRF